MFLYARIVLDHVVDLISINDIRTVLRIPPADLNHAQVPKAFLQTGCSNLFCVHRYELVFSRIKKLPPWKQGTVKAILGWIGSSPVPLTIHELEQAIVVSTQAHDDAPSVDSSLNIVKLCGPIVEVMDGTPQFVHFTVKE